MGIFSKESKTSDWTGGEESGFRDNTNNSSALNGLGKSALLTVSDQDTQRPAGKDLAELLDDTVLVMHHRETELDARDTELNPDPQARRTFVALSTVRTCLSTLRMQVMGQHTFRPKTLENGTWTQAGELAGRALDNWDTIMDLTGKGWNIKHRMDMEHPLTHQEFVQLKNELDMARSDLESVR